MGKIIVFGSINQDFFSYVERFPRPGESVRGKRFQIGNGGKGANQAVTAAKLGASVTIIGMVGDDMFADSAINNLKESGVNTNLIQRVPNINTGCAVITVDEKGENNIIITPGANDKLTAKRAIELEDQIKGAKLLMCQAEVHQDANLEALKLAKKHRVTTFFNPAPCNSSLNPELFKYTDILCTNETETEMISGSKIPQSMDDFKRVARKLLGMGPKLLIITLGKDGAVIAEKLDHDEVKIIKVTSPQVEAIDTTGAGDCFCGSFAFLLTNYPDLGYSEAAKKSAKVAALSVSRNGCQSSYPSIDEVQKEGILDS